MEESTRYLLEKGQELIVQFLTENRKHVYSKVRTPDERKLLNIAMQVHPKAILHKELSIQLGKKGPALTKLKNRLNESLEYFCEGLIDPPIHLYFQSSEPKIPNAGVHLACTLTKSLTSSSDYVPLDQLKKVLEDATRVLLDKIKGEKEDLLKDVGELLTVEHITPNNNDSLSKTIIVGQTPGFHHLREGCFKHRERIFTEAWNSLSEWIERDNIRTQPTKNKMPVFWISGRSGDGKSVLFLQLIGNLIQTYPLKTILFLRTHEELFQLLLKTSTNEKLTSQKSETILVCLDDLYNISGDVVDWEERIDSILSQNIPAVSILTTGPKEKLFLCRKNMRNVFEVSNYTVPPPLRKEYQEFSDWYQARTGESREIARFTITEPLLVQFIFQLVGNTTLPEFARRFKKRLSDLDFFETARIIIALNALDISAPLTLFSSHEDRDVLEWLIAEKTLQLSNITSFSEKNLELVRLAHSQIAWALLTEWYEMPTNISKSLARDLIKSVELDARDDVSLFRIIIQRLRNTHFADKDAKSSDYSSKANHYELFKEMYEIAFSKFGLKPTEPIFLEWLETIYCFPSLKLRPDPIEICRNALNQALLAPNIHGIAAAWLWLISEQLPQEKEVRNRKAVQKFLLQYPDNIGIGHGLQKIILHAEKIKLVIRVIKKWLAENPSNPQTVDFIPSLLNKVQYDIGLKLPVVRWIDNNPNDRYVPMLYKSLVKASPRNGIIISRTIKWITENEMHPECGDVCATLIRNNPTIKRVYKCVIEWLQNHLDNESSHCLIISLLRVRTRKRPIIEYALDWLDNNPYHDDTLLLTGALIKAAPSYESVIQKALQCILQNQYSESCWILVTSLVKANPYTSQIRETAAEWIIRNKNNNKLGANLSTIAKACSFDENIVKAILVWLSLNFDCPSSYFVLVPLVKARPHDDIIVEQALCWVEKHPRHEMVFFPLATLLKSRRNKQEVIDLALDWISSNNSHKGAPFLIKSLLYTNIKTSVKTRISCDWIQANISCKEVPDLLIMLSRLCPNESEVNQLCERWLSSQSKRSDIYKRFIKEMILVSRGAPKWIELGKDCLKRSLRKNENILAALLSACPNVEYIKLALKYRGRASTRKSLQYLLFDLAKALVNDPESAAECLNTLDNEKDKRFICNAIAYGIRRYTQISPLMFTEGLPNMSVSDSTRIINSIIKLDVTTELVIDSVIKWLNKIYHQPGYEGILEILRRHIDWWQNLISYGKLNNQIIKDYYKSRFIKHKTTNPQYIERIQRGIKWLKKNSHERPSWVNLWLGLWVCRLRNKDRELLCKIGIDYLEETSLDNVTWHRIWKVLYKYKYINKDTKYLVEIGSNRLQKLSPDNEFYGYIWQDVWESRKPDEITKELVESGIHWLKEVASSNPSWYYVWKPIRDYYIEGTYSRRLQEIAIRWLLKAPLSHSSWPFVWTDVWDVDSNPEDNSKILDRGFEWLKFIDAENSSLGHIWQRMWKYTAENTYRKDLTYFTLNWLKKVSSDSKDWTYLWNGLWNSELDDKKRMDLVELGITWLQEVNYNNERWGYIWVPIWKYEPKKQIIPQLVEIGVDWLDKTSLGHISWPVIWLYLSKSPFTDNLCSDLIKYGLKFLEKEELLNHESWGYIWQSLWTGKMDSLIREILEDRGLNWLNQVKPEHISWQYVWRDLREGVTDAKILDKLKLSGINWLFKVSFQHKSWPFVWTTLWREQPSIELSKSGIKWLEEVSTDHMDNPGLGMLLSELFMNDPSSEFLLNLVTRYLAEIPSTRKSWQLVSKALRQITKNN